MKIYSLHPSINSWCTVPKAHKARESWKVLCPISSMSQGESIEGACAAALAIVLAYRQQEDDVFGD